MATTYLLRIGWAASVRIAVMASLCVALFGCHPPPYRGEPGQTVDCDDTTEPPMLLMKGIASGSGATIHGTQISRIERHETKGSPIRVDIYLHPLDSAGNFLTGLVDSKREHRSYQIVDSSETIETIHKFTVREVDEEQREPLAIALVLDHSGSMGTERAIILQRAVARFLATKKDEDAIAVVKFDEVARTEQSLSPTHPHIDTNGLDGYGGGTALFDAINEGILNLDTAGAIARTLVVITDGMENASKQINSAKQLIDLANAKGINISCIGFGQNIDTILLADSLAGLTGGVFYAICHTKDFNFIFDDIYRRFKNYYQIEYQISRHMGVHTVTVELRDSSRTFASKASYIEPSTSILQIHFDNDSWVIHDDSSTIALANILHILQSNRTDRVEIAGYTDSTGDDEHNLVLSTKRAEAVKLALIKMGLQSARVTSVGNGKTRPIADNGTPEGRAANRRVEFKIIRNGQTHEAVTKHVYRSPNDSSS